MASKRATIADTIFYIGGMGGLGYLTAIARSCKLVVAAPVMKELSRKRSVEHLRKLVAPAGLDYDISVHSARSSTSSAPCGASTR